MVNQKMPLTLKQIDQRSSKLDKSEAANPDRGCILELRELTVQRGDFPLCQKVNLCLNTGDICHLIGANGTGKTTLMMQLVGLLPLIEGKVFYQGIEQMPNAPLYVSHQLGIHPSLTVSQNLTFLLNLYGISPSRGEINDALDWVGLTGFEHMSSNQLSAGQTRRVTLARLYLMAPQHTPIWLLDEPFTALDVSMVDRLGQRLQQFANLGGAVFMTSHQQVNIATKQLNLSDFVPEYMSDEDYMPYKYDEDLEQSTNSDLCNSPTVITDNTRQQVNINEPLNNGDKVNKKVNESLNNRREVSK